METYSIIYSSSSTCCAQHNYSPGHLQPLPAEAIQMNNTHEGLFSATRNYLQSDQSHISSTSGLSHDLLEAKSMVGALNSGEYSAITSENNSLKMDTGGDIIDHHRNGHKKKAIFDVEGDDEDDKGRNEVSGGKKKGEKKVRRPRFAFQTRSQVDILDDGYRWRKYGQKAVKNNHFPRSYYRCTHQGCSVKKQVQRLSKDEEVVVTTYEGIHTHPIERNNDNFEQILNQMQIYSRFS
ncbi:hypothetical protein IEQ34_009808 [Dendrobium chrysotoxum]|uniref:WRKY domain-containing protein n=1 Tax=Dendrobium chrysotoxum TaxID=161865 RepID=A0AAV7H3Y3_DENCH|nr:hypothetical protein IEQ34_009808 [Dendrobium chrysotoxum]